LERALDKFDFATFVLSADDTTTVRNEETASIRDNVVLQRRPVHGTDGP
jgi:predicted nucleotide-binding protein